MPTREPYLWKPALVEAAQARLDAGDDPAQAAQSLGLKSKQVVNAITQGRLTRTCARNKSLAPDAGGEVSSESAA